MRYLGQIEENQPEVKYMGPLISEQPKVIQPFATLSPQEGLFEGQAEITPYGVKVKPYFLSEEDLPEQNQKIERSKVLSTTLNIPFSAAYDQEEELSKEFQKHDSSWMKTATNSFKRGIGNTYVTFGRALQLTGMKDFGEDFVAYGKGLQYIYAPPIKPTEFTFDKVLTPEFWANDVAESIPFTLSLIPAALIAGYAGAGTATAIGLGAFGKVVLGSIGAGVISRTIESAFEAGGTYDEALTAGESDEEARTRADYTFKHNLAPLTGVDIAQFLIAFTPLGKMGGGNILAKRIAATVVKLGAVAAMEAGEEVWQERVQQIARGEKPHVSPEMKEAGVIGAIFGLGLGGAGSVWTAMTERVANTASPKLLEVYEETKNAQLSMGATQEEAHLAGLDAMAETPEGKAHIERVMTKIKDMAEGKIVEEETIKKETKEAEQFVEKSPEIDVLTDEDIRAIAEGRESIDVISERLGEEEIEGEVSRETAKYLELDKEFVDLRDRLIKGETLSELELRRYEDLKFKVPYWMEKAGITEKELTEPISLEEQRWVKIKQIDEETARLKKELNEAFELREHQRIIEEIEKSPRIRDNPFLRALELGERPDRPLTLEEKTKVGSINRIKKQIEALNKKRDQTFNIKEFERLLDEIRFEPLPPEKVSKKAMAVSKEGIKEPSQIVAYREYIKGYETSHPDTGTFFWAEKPEVMKPSVKTFIIKSQNPFKISSEEIKDLALPLELEKPMDYPSYSLLLKWFPEYGEMIEGTREIYNVTSFEADKLVKNEAIKRGYDAIIYGEGEKSQIQYFGKEKPFRVPEKEVSREAIPVIEEGVEIDRIPTAEPGKIKEVPITPETLKKYPFLGPASTFKKEDVPDYSFAWSNRWWRTKERSELEKQFNLWPREEGLDPIRIFDQTRNRYAERKLGQLTRDEAGAVGLRARVIKDAFEKHRKSVQKAYSEGEKISPEVLADYPELQQVPPREAMPVIEEGVKPYKAKIFEKEFIDIVPESLEKSVKNLLEAAGKFFPNLMYFKEVMGNKPFQELLKLTGNIDTGLLDKIMPSLDKKGLYSNEYLRTVNNIYQRSTVDRLFDPSRFIPDMNYVIERTNSLIEATKDEFPQISIFYRDYVIPFMQDIRKYFQSLSKKPSEPEMPPTRLFPEEKVSKKPMPVIEEGVKTTEAGGGLRFIPHPFYKNNITIWIDVKKLDSSWRKGLKEMYVGPEGSGEIEGRVSALQEFLKIGKPIEQPQLTIDDIGIPIFGDGRHRFALLRDMGIEKIPVSVPKEKVEKIRQLFGAKEILPSGKGIGAYLPGKEVSKEAMAVIEEGVKPKQFISEETYEKAKKSLKEKLSPGTLRAGIDPTALVDMVTIGAYHIEQGVRKFVDWSEAMIMEFGQDVRPYLKRIWKEANAYLEEKVPTKKVKGLVRETTGQVSLSNLIREDVALSAAMKKAEQNARIAYRAGQKDAIEKAKAEFRDVLLRARIKAEVFAFKEGFRVGSRLTATHLIQGFKDDQITAKETRNMLTNYIEDNLPPDLRGKFLNAIIQNMTKKKQASIWQRVDKTREELERKKLVSEIGELKELKGDISLDYQRKVKELIGDIDTKKITSKTFEKLKGLKDYIEKNGIPSGIKNETLDKIKRLEMRGAEEMTTEELKFLADTATHLTNLGKLKQELKYKYNERIRKVAIDKLLASTFNLDPELTGEDTLMDKVKKGTMFLYLDTLQNPRVTDMIDGYQRYQGQNTKHVKNLIVKETKAILTTRTIIDSAVQEMIDTGLGELTEEQQQKIMINIRNIEGAFDQVKTLMENYGYKDIPTLTKEENRVIDIIRKYTNQYVGQIAATYEEIENKEFVKLDNYILPIKYEKELNIIPAEAIEQSRHRITQTFKGFTIERQKGVKKLPRTDILGIFEEGINEQQWYIQMQPELENIKYLVKSKEYVEKAGELASNWWRDHLDIVARRGNSATASHTPFSNLLKAFRFNLNNAILGYKLSSIVMQPFAIIDATAYTQAHYGSLATLEIVKEFTKAFVIPQYAKEFIDVSPALQVRRGGEVAIQETLEKIGRSENLSSKFIRGGLSLLVKADVKTAAGVEMGLLNVLEKYNIPNAKEEAEFLMNMVSSSSEVTFRPHILSRGEGAKAWLTFQTFFLNRWGFIAHDLIVSGLIKGNWKAKYSAMLGLGIIIAGAIAEDEARRFMYEKITRRKMPDKTDLLEDIIFALPRNIPFFGNFLDFSGKSEIPIIRVFENLFRAKNVITGKTTEAKIRGLMKSLESIATLTGISGTAQFFDLMEGIFLGEEEKKEEKPKIIKPKLKR